MDLVSYLSNIYGYDTPIFLKDVRIGRKSKTAIREAFYRASKSGKLVKDGNGIYYLKSNKEFGAAVTFESIVLKKFIYENGNDEFNDLFVCGYFSGMTFLNMIGISEQVPAIYEITTNKTSSKKRFYKHDRRWAILRKGKTEINYQNYRMLQFLDMFRFLSLWEIKEKRDILTSYIKKHKLTKKQFNQYIGLYGADTIKKIVEGGLLDAFLRKGI